MKTVYLVLEKDYEVEHLGYEDIFITDSLDKIPNLLKEYYGSFEELSYQDIRDSGLEYKKELRITGNDENYKVSILVKNYQLNQL
jgi:hypothetical protein